MNDDPFAADGPFTTPPDERHGADLPRHEFRVVRHGKNGCKLQTWHNVEKRPVAELVIPEVDDLDMTDAIGFVCEFAKPRELGGGVIVHRQDGSVVVQAPIGRFTVTLTEATAFYLRERGPI